MSLADRPPEKLNPIRLADTAGALGAGAAAGVAVFFVLAIGVAAARRDGVPNENFDDMGKPFCRFYFKLLYVYDLVLIKTCCVLVMPREFYRWAV